MEYVENRLFSNIYSRVKDVLDGEDRRVNFSSIAANRFKEEVGKYLRSPNQESG